MSARQVLEQLAAALVPALIVVLGVAIVALLGAIWIQRRRARERGYLEERR